MKAKSERRRLFIGDQVEDCRDASGLFYILPFQKGLLVNWDIQKTIWDYIFSKDCCPTNFSETPCIITEPYFNFASIQEAMAEIFFEEFECQSFLRKPAGDLVEYHYRQLSPTIQACLVVDLGYSFSHVAPYIKGKALKSAIRRIDVGGKILTNHLKEIISYRQLHVMEETYVMNQVKEDTCFVSNDLMADMAIAKLKYPENTIVRDYILPDFTKLRRGYEITLDKPPVLEQQKLRMNNERFSVPEVLFYPSDVGINQMGISEAIHNSIESCPEEARSHLYRNIVVVGGSSQFAGFKERLFKDVRSSAPDEYDVRIHVPDNPITFAWEGGKLLSKDPEFYTYVVTKEEYEEEGPTICLERFDS
ncbi:actin-related protein 6 isoform X2 [Cimex lectularius]|nr:actin-related protein 6 isoform X2 [Cimex lectularius]XP_024080552.1 actin-related protein 6 isoform X2 [Cimex lectularius]